MALALAQARAAADRGEVPVGAVLIDEGGAVVAAFGNQVEQDHDPTAHAEMLATLEPCPMCAAAISLARIRRLYFAAYDPKGGGVEHGPRIFEQPTCHHRPEVYGGIAEKPAGSLLRKFFQARR